MHYYKVKLVLFLVMRHKKGLNLMLPDKYPDTSYTEGLFLSFKTCYMHGLLQANSREVGTDLILAMLIYRQTDDTNQYN